VASLIWLIVWLIEGMPNLEWFGTWNDWSVALLACVIFDVFGGAHGVRSRRRGGG
jgi:hypothetical protein